MSRGKYSGLMDCLMQRTFKEKLLEENVSQLIAAYKGEPITQQTSDNSTPIS